ncbi:MAG: amidohydrolase family protein [Cupriavidus necator]
MPNVPVAAATAAAPARPPPPAGACDAHIHVFDPRHAGSTPAPPDATVSHYRQVQARLGTTRAVVVQPRPYGTDNTVTLAAIAELGIDHARGVAVLRPDVMDRELQALHDGGIRGARFTLYTPEHAAVGFDQVEPLAHRVQGWGWHLQLHWTADQIVAHAAMLERLPTALVFDHMARLPAEAGTRHPAFAVVSKLLLEGRAWVKLSGPYLCSRGGAAGRYADVAPLARAWVCCAPDRLVWGSDWPHVTEGGHRPDDLDLFDLLSDWAGTEEIRRRVLVDNPAALYGFAHP